MTKKHFEALAVTLGTTLGKLRGLSAYEEDAILSMAALFCKGQSPKFDENMFITAILKRKKEWRAANPPIEVPQT